MLEKLELMKVDEENLDSRESSKKDSKSRSSTSRESSLDKSSAWDSETELTTHLNKMKSQVFTQKSTGNNSLKLNTNEYRVYQ